MAFIGHPTVGPEAGIGKPTGATNLITNGGFETDTTGWSVVGTATIARSTAASLFGSASLLVNPPANNDGTSFAGTGNAGQGDTYTASGFVKAVTAGDEGQLQVFIVNTGGTFEIFSTTVEIVAAAWTRFTFTFTWAETLHTGWVLTVRDASGGGKDFYLDGVQYESGSVATPYIETDGASATRSPLKVVGP